MNRVKPLREGKLVEKFGVNECYIKGIQVNCIRWSFKLTNKIIKKNNTQIYRYYA